MEISNLWDNLQPKIESIVNLKLDLSEGKVPELPYFIVGNDEVKSKIGDQIKAIDGDRMVTNFLIGHYGNGKTNLLKYLELFYENHKQVSVIYSRANVDQPDLVLFLLKQVNDHYADILVKLIIKSR